MRLQNEVIPSPLHLTTSPNLYSGRVCPLHLPLHHCFFSASILRFFSKGWGSSNMGFQETRVLPSLRTMLFLSQPSTVDGGGAGSSSTKSSSSGSPGGTCQPVQDGFLFLLLPLRVGLYAQTSSPPILGPIHHLQLEGPSRPSQK